MEKSSSNAALVIKKLKKRGLGQLCCIPSYLRNKKQRYHNKILREIMQLGFQMAKLSVIYVFL